MIKYSKYRVFIVYVILILFTKLTYSQVKNIPTYDVVIVGAGTAGLSAAYELNDYKVLVLEKGNYIGGRIYTKVVDGVGYDLGAICEYETDYIPFKCNLSRKIKEDYPVGIYYNNKIYYGNSNLECILNATSDPIELNRINDFKNFKNDIYSLSPESQKLLGAFFNLIYSGDIHDYTKERQLDGFLRYPTNHHVNGYGDVINGYISNIKAEIKLNSEVVSVEDISNMVKITYFEQYLERVIYAKCAIVATPSFVARKIIKFQNPIAKTFLDSLKYGNGIVAAIGFRGSKFEKFSYIATLGLISNGIGRHTTKDVDVIYNYYYNVKLSDKSDNEIIYETLKLIDTLKIATYKQTDIVFTDVKRWDVVSHIISPQLYYKFDELCLRPTNRVFLAGDYTYSRLPYMMKSSILSGMCAAKKVIYFYLKK